MTTDPHPNLLNRDVPAAEVQKLFPLHLSTIVDMVNYGTLLILRAYGSSEKTTVDVIVLGVLLKQIVAMLDAIEVLLRAGIVHAAFLQSRAGLEAMLYLAWILKGDAVRKANCYVVANLRHDRLWALRTTRGTREALAYESILGQLDIDIFTRHPNIEQDAAKQIELINRNLAQQGLADIDKKFDEMRGKRDFDPDWYKVAGAESLRKIANEVGRRPQYEVYYSTGSHVTHSALYRQHVQFRGDEVRLLGIRSARNIDDLLHSAMQTAVLAYGDVLRHYRPEELANFRRYYTENWRAAFTSVPNVKIEEK